VMEADPRVGDRYPQEIAPGVAEDTAQVLSVGADLRLCHYDDLLLTQETSPLKPGVVELKCYAEGIGFIRGSTIQGGDEHADVVRIADDQRHDDDHDEE